MPASLYRSVDEPFRTYESWGDMWDGPDKGLIWCWERGRLYRLEGSELVRRAEGGELAPLDWKGGVQKKLKIERKFGTLKYLATWQGLRGEDLDIDLEGEREIVCSRSGQTVFFSAKLPPDEEEQTP